MKPTRRGFLGTLIAGAVLPKIKLPTGSPVEPMKPIENIAVSSSESDSYSISTSWAYGECRKCGAELDDNDKCPRCTV